MRPAAPVVEDGDAEVFERTLEGKLDVCEPLAELVLESPVFRGEDDVDRGITFDDDLVILHEEGVDPRAGRAIDIAPLHRVEDVLVGEGVHADIRRAAVGAHVLHAVIMVIIPHRAEEAFAVVQHIFVDDGAVLGARLELGGIVQDLEGPQSLRHHIVFARIERPIRMIELHQKSRFLRTADRLVDTLRRIDAIISVTAEILLESLVISTRVPDGARGVEGVVRIARKQIDMDGFLIPPKGRGIVDRIFHGSERHEMLVAEIRIVVQDLVIAVRDDLVSVRHIALLDLLGRQAPVGKHGMTVQIRLAPLLFGIDKVFLHDDSSVAIISFLSRRFKETQALFSSRFSHTGNRCVSTRKSKAFFDKEYHTAESEYAKAIALEKINPAARNAHSVDNVLVVFVAYPTFARLPNFCTITELLHDYAYSRKNKNREKARNKAEEWSILNKSR